MSNDINIVIKSQSQPDGGEGSSAGNALRGNAAGEEGLCANMRGDAQVPRSADKTGQSSGPDHQRRITPTKARTVPRPNGSGK